MNQGITALYLALVSKRKGNLKEARALAARAAQLHPQPWILTRIARDFPEAQKSAAKE